VLGEKIQRSCFLPDRPPFEPPHNDESVIGSAAKRNFQRLRPFNFDATVKPVCKTGVNFTHYGYPSGHSLTGYLEVLALIPIVPKKARCYFRSRGRLCAQPGSLRGPLNNALFKTELDAARMETGQALGH
jgi:hypothetical protein